MSGGHSPNDIVPIGKTSKRLTIKINKRTMEGQRTLVVGATGYLGGFIVRALRQTEVQVIALVRPTSSAAAKGRLTSLGAGLVEGCVPESLHGLCTGVHTVVSSMAANLSRSGHSSIWAVDRDANIALFEEAAQAGVSHFILVATFEGREARSYSQLSEAKEQAVDHITQRAQQLNMRCSIIRPPAYFKDFTDWPWEAIKTGSITLLGSGTAPINPIHGADMAEFIARLVLNPSVDPANTTREQQQQHGQNAGQGGSLVQQYRVGGPDVLSLLQVVHIAAEVQGKAPGEVRVRHVPIWVARLIVWASRLLSRVSERAGRLAIGLEFAVFSCTHAAVGKRFGSRTVRQYYEEKARLGG